MKKSVSIVRMKQITVSDIHVSARMKAKKKYRAGTQCKYMHQCSEKLLQLNYNNSIVRLMGKKDGVQQPTCINPCHSDKSRKQKII